MLELSTLEKVDLRNVWKTEDQDFTPWLAQEKNLSILGNAIGIELELEAQEKNVGPFRADISCRDTLDESWVLIELVTSYQSSGIDAGTLGLKTDDETVVSFHMLMEDTWKDEFHAAQQDQ